MATKTLTKIPVEDPQAPDLGSVLSWGLRFSNYEEVFLIGGIGDIAPDFQVRHPNDPLGQTRAVLAEVQDMLARGGYTLDNVVRTEATVTRDFNLEANFQGFNAICAETFRDVAVKPTVGVLRVVDALAVPGMLIEIEVMAAK